MKSRYSARNGLGTSRVLRISEIVYDDGRQRHV
jgi:hypothetical protein